MPLGENSKIVKFALNFVILKSFKVTGGPKKKGILSQYETETDFLYQIDLYCLTMMQISAEALTSIIDFSIFCGMLPY